LRGQIGTNTFIGVGSGIVKRQACELLEQNGEEAQIVHSP
jgi:hypothetical protein